MNLETVSVASFGPIDIRHATAPLLMVAITTLIRCLMSVSNDLLKVYIDPSAFILLTAGGGAGK